MATRATVYTKFANNHSHIAISAYRPCVMYACLHYNIIACLLQVLCPQIIMFKRSKTLIIIFLALAVHLAVRTVHAMIEFAIVWRRDVDLRIKYFFCVLPGLIMPLELKTCNSLTKEVAVSKPVMMENIKNSQPSTAMTEEEEKELEKQMISNEFMASPLNSTSRCETFPSLRISTLPRQNILQTTGAAAAANSSNNQEPFVMSGNHHEGMKSSEVSVHTATTTTTSDLHRTSSPSAPAGITSEMEYVVQKIAALARSTSPSDWTDAKTKIKFGSTD